MKKIILILMILMTVCSVAFANNVLDLNRWKLCSQGSISLSYFDTQSIRVRNSSVFSVWVCVLTSSPGEGCGFAVCKRNGIDKKEHYHFSFEDYDLDSYTATLRSIVIRDINGKTIFSTVFSTPTPSPVMPETVGETTMLTIKQYIDEHKINR